MMLSAEHFEDLEKQTHAARLGLWVFLASEALLFGAIVTLFLACRAEDRAGFHAAAVHNTKVLGSINTGVLLVSSTSVACSVHAIRAGRRALASILVGGTMLLGAVFLVIKIVEYADHFRHGIHPGAGSLFWTLYFGMTGLHAIHVTVGLGVLATLLAGVLRGRVHAARTHPLELGATYWHLVDVVWIFLWPLLYLS